MYQRKDRLIICVIVVIILIRHNVVKATESLLDRSLPFATTITVMSSTTARYSGLVAMSNQLLNTTSIVFLLVHWLLHVRCFSFAYFLKVMGTEASSFRDPKQSGAKCDLITD